MRYILSNRMLKKSLNLSCSCSLFGLSGLSRLIGLFGLSSFIWLHQTNQIDQTDRLVSDMRTIGFQEGRHRFPTTC